MAAQAGSAALAAPLAVVGWALPDLSGDAPPADLGDDPVVGRQICPPLSHLDLSEGRSEEVIARKITAAVDGSWHLELRQGLHWWNGADLKAADVAAFVEQALPQLVQARGSGLWTLPSHTVSTDGEARVVVKWTEPPVFGPFIFDGAPLWQPARGSAYKFQCAGAYRPEKTAFGLALRQTPGYAFKALPPQLDVYEAGKKPPAPAAFDFRLADQFSGSPDVRPSEQPGSCALVVDLPAATLIAWNTRKGPTADPAFRALLTQLTPRGALIRSGSASLGELLSAPIPRQHPGYNQAVLVRPFDLDGTSSALEKLGYKRAAPEGTRVDRNGKPLVLTIRADRGSASLAAKVIVDAFTSVGIKTQFEDEKAPGEPDGFLAAVSLDWPRSDLLGNFHSKAVKPDPFWSLSDPELDRLLETYALSLTRASPSFGTLQQIHRKLFELEPVTVLLQHKACLDPRGSPRPVAKINPKDPDWFRQIIL